MANLCKKKHKKIKKLYLILISVILVFVIIFGYINLFINPVIFATNEAHIKSLTINAINSAVSSTLNGSNIYDNIISITKSTTDEVSLIQVNTANINSLSNMLAVNGQTELEEMGNAGFPVPLGTFTGIPIFNGLGPDIYIKMVTIGHLTYKFNSQFKSVGINQTHHSILLMATANISILLPASKKNVEINTEVLIAETIIVGKVPEVYLNTNNLTNALNLIPNN